MTAQVAEDARVSSSVVKKHYVKETDELLRQKATEPTNGFWLACPAMLLDGTGYSDGGDPEPGASSQGGPGSQELAACRAP